MSQDARLRNLIVAAEILIAAVETPKDEQIPWIGKVRKVPVWSEFADAFRAYRREADASDPVRADLPAPWAAGG